MASVNVTAGTPSADIAVTRNAVFSLVTDKPVQVYAKNANSGEYVPMAAATKAQDNKAYIATSDAVQLRCTTAENAKVDIG